MTYKKATQQATASQTSIQQVLATDLDSDDMNTDTLKSILTYMTIHRESEFSSTHQTLCRNPLSLTRQPRTHNTMATTPTPEVQGLVDFLLDDTDGSRYQLLNRQSIVDSEYMDAPYTEALRIVIAQTEHLIEGNAS